ncbi:MAG: alpha/beta hydrolase [Nitrospirota bacterium]
MNYVIGCVVTLLALAGWVSARYESDHAEVTARLARDSHVATTACGPIEYSEVGSGPAVLAIHGAGGGYPQMAEFGDTLAPAGFRVVAVSRFGYLRTPSPIHAGVKEQAAAHACLLDSLGIATAAVFGVSAGAPSSIEFCLDFPARCSALVLLVPAAFPPGTTTKDTTPPSPYMSFVLDHVLGSDFLIWTVTRVAPHMLIETVLATPIAVYRNADSSEQARALRIIQDIFPVSQRIEGLRIDARMAAPLSAEELQTISVPTLAMSCADDLYRTLAGASYAATHIPGARLVTFQSGGHGWLGHDAEVKREIVQFLRAVTLSNVTGKGRNRTKD